MEEEVKRRGKSVKGEQRRAQVIEAARSSFLDRGYEDFSMRGVASQCNMKLKNLQYYFPTKEDLFVGITRYYYTDTLRAMKQYPRSSKEPSGKLIALETVILDKWDLHSSAIWTQLFCMAHHSPKMRDLKVEIYENWCTEMVDLLKSYYPRASPRKLYKVARILAALIDGFVFARTERIGESTDFVALQKDILKASKLIAETHLA